MLNGITGEAIRNSRFLLRGRQQPQELAFKPWRCPPTGL